MIFLLLWYKYELFFHVSDYSSVLHTHVLCRPRQKYILFVSRVWLRSNGINPAHCSYRVSQDLCGSQGIKGCRWWVYFKIVFHRYMTEFTYWLTWLWQPWTARFRKKPCHETGHSKKNPYMSSLKFNTPEIHQRVESYKSIFQVNIALANHFAFQVN